MSIKISYLVLGISSTLISCTNNEKNDLFVQSKLNIKDTSENLISTQITFQTETHESLNLEKFKLIGIVNSYDPKNSQALLRIGDDKPSIFKENQYIDRDIKLFKINKESRLLKFAEYFRYWWTWHFTFLFLWHFILLCWFFIQRLLFSICLLLT